MNAPKDAEQAKREAREILRRAWSRHGQAAKPLSQRRKEQIIEEIRKSREELWEEKLASRP